MKKVILMFLVLFTFGCANLDVIHYGSSGLLGGGAEKTYWNGRYLLEPNYSNNFESVIWISEKASITDVKNKAFEICSSKGGLKSVATDKDAYGFYKFQCNGFQSAVNPTPIISPTSKQSLSIEEAKQQCKELGRKPGTDKFGECVLELSK